MATCDHPAAPGPFGSDRMPRDGHAKIDGRDVITMTVKAFVVNNSNGEGHLEDVDPSLVDGLELVEPPPWHEMYGMWVAYVVPVAPDELPDGVDANYVGAVFASGLGWDGENDAVHGDLYFFGPPESNSVTDVPPPLVLSAVFYYMALADMAKEEEQHHVS